MNNYVEKKIWKVSVFSANGEKIGGKSTSRSQNAENVINSSWSHQFMRKLKNEIPIEKKSDTSENDRANRRVEYF